MDILWRLVWCPTHSLFLIVAKNLTSSKKSIPSCRDPTVDHRMATGLANFRLYQVIMSRGFGMKLQFWSTIESNQHGGIHERSVAELEPGSGVAGEADFLDILLAGLGEDV